MDFRKISRPDSYRKIPDLVRRNRVKAWLIFVLALLLLAPGVTRFQLDLSDEAFLSGDDEVRVAYDNFRAEFGGDESIYLVYRAKDGDIFSDASLKALYGIQEDILNYRLTLEPGQPSPLDHIVDVTTLINVSYLEASDDALISRPFIGNNLPQTETEREELRRLALDHPDYPLVYLSRDGKYGGMLMRTDFKTVLLNEMSEEDILLMDDPASFDVSDTGSALAEIKDERPEFEPIAMEDYVTLTHAVYEIIDNPEYTAALEFYPIGAPIINAYIFDNFVPQVNAVMIATTLIIMGMLWILFRSFAAVVWPIAIVIVSAILVVAVLGWLDLRMNLMVNIIILLIFVVGVADSVHILSGYIFFRNKGENHDEALRSTYQKSGPAVMLTSLTTSLGMLALVVMPIVPLKIFGFAAALGVLFAFVITLFYLPLMLDMWSPLSKKRIAKIEAGDGEHHIIQSLLRRVEQHSFLRPGLNIAIFTAITLLLIGGLSRVSVDSNFIKMFKEDASVRIAYELVDSRLGGTMGLEILVDGGEANALHTPELLNAISEAQDYLEKNFDDVITTRSIVDIVKDSNKALHGGRDEEYAIPQDPLLLKQTLFLFDSANPADRRKVVSDDYSKGHITANMRGSGTKGYVKKLDLIRPEIDRIFDPVKTILPGLEVTVTGGMTLLATIINYISWSQITGFGLALLAISFILFFTFGSMRIGLLALYPNLFPIITVFGLMGYLGIPLDADTLIIAPIMIGIVVDDTIHFLTHYRLSLLKGVGMEEAFISTFREVGQAITFTSLILACAFLAFIGLDHQGLMNFGILASAAIIAALLGDLFLLPALLKITNTGLTEEELFNNRIPVPIEEGALS